MRTLAYFVVDPNVSTGQESLGRRTRAFDSFCATKGHTNHGVFAEHARDAHRPRYAEMLTFIKQSRVAYLVVVPSVGHLGATVREQVGRVLELDSLQCQVVCDDPVTPDPLQSALKTLPAASSNPRRERIMEGMRAKASKGLGLGKPPYGYRVDVEGVLRPVPAEAEVVRRIYRMYLSDGLGVRTIAKRLNDDGVRTRRGQDWSMVTVRDILRNSAYIGTYRRFGLRIPGSYEAVVSNDEYRRAQERMRSRTPARKHAKAEPFLLAGLLYCGHCGRKMMGVTRHQTWRRRDGQRTRGDYRYYQCQSRINRDDCDYRTMRAEEIEESVAERLRGLAPEIGAKLALGAGDAVATASPEAGHVEARLRALDRRYVDLVRRAANGAMTVQQLRLQVRDVEAERAQLERRIEVPSLPAHALDFEGHVRERLNGGWAGLGPTARRDLVHALVERVTVKDGAVDVTLRR